MQVAVDLEPTVAAVANSTWLEDPQSRRPLVTKSDSWENKGLQVSNWCQGNDYGFS
jgi:hypothetical protein